MQWAFQISEITQWIHWFKAISWQIWLFDGSKDVAAVFILNITTVRQREAKLSAFLFQFICIECLKLQFLCIEYSDVFNCQGVLVDRKWIKWSTVLRCWWVMDRFQLSLNQVNFDEEAFGESEELHSFSNLVSYDSDFREDNSGGNPIRAKRIEQYKGHSTRHIDWSPFRGFKKYRTISDHSLYLIIIYNYFCILGGIHSHLLQLRFD